MLEMPVWSLSARLSHASLNHQATVEYGHSLMTVGKKRTLQRRTMKAFCKLCYHVHSKRCTYRTAVHVTLVFTFYTTTWYVVLSVILIYPYVCTFIFIFSPLKSFEFFQTSEKYAASELIKRMENVLRCFKKYFSPSKSWNIWNYLTRKMHFARLRNKQFLQKVKKYGGLFKERHLMLFQEIFSFFSPLVV